MSESNCAAPAEKPSRSSPSISDRPSETSRGPTCRRSPARVVTELVAGADPDGAVDVQAPALRCPLRRYGLVLDQDTVDASFAERPVRVAKEETSHHRFGMVVSRAPVIEALGLGKMNESDVRGRERVTHEVDRGLLRVPQRIRTSS